MIIKKGNTGEQGTEKKLSRDSGLKACMNDTGRLSSQAAQAHYLWVRASEVIWWEYTRIISVLSDAK